MQVSDFGSSRDVAKMAMTQVGTPLFSAPEIMAHEPYDGSADVWSFGCIMSCAYFCAVEPYPREQLHSQNVSGILRAVINGQLVPIHPEGSPYGEIGTMCTELDPGSRPSFLKLCEMLQEGKLMRWAGEMDAKGDASSFTKRRGSFNDGSFSKRALKKNPSDPKSLVASVIGEGLSSKPGAAPSPGKSASKRGFLARLGESGGRRAR